MAKKDKDQTSPGTRDQTGPPDRDVMIQLVMTIPDRDGAIKFGGGEGDGGSVLFEVPGTNGVELIKLLQVRGQILDVQVRIKQ